MPRLEKINFHPVIKIKEPLPVFDFTDGMDHSEIEKKEWGIGRYNEMRNNMYTAPQYENRRNIHMGIDIFCPAGEPVFAAWDAEIAHLQNHDQQGNYGPTIILRHELEDRTLYALHGHLSLLSLEINEMGKKLNKGEQFAWIGSVDENGGWPPHLHYQISFEDPGEADMPGVVAEEEREEALKKYPDPNFVLRLLPSRDEQD